LVVDAEPLVAAAADLQLVPLAGVPAAGRHVRVEQAVDGHEAAGHHSGDESDGPGPAQRQRTDGGGTHDGDGALAEHVGVVAAGVVDARLDGEVDGAGLAVEDLAGQDQVVVEDAHLAQLDGQRVAGRVPATDARLL
jgi:hypothetical protein